MFGVALAPYLSGMIAMFAMFEASDTVKILSVFSPLSLLIYGIGRAKAVQRKYKL